MTKLLTITTSQQLANCNRSLYGMANVLKFGDGQGGDGSFGTITRMCDGTSLLQGYSVQGDGVYCNGTLLGMPIIGSDRMANGRNPSFDVEYCPVEYQLEELVPKQRSRWSGCRKIVPN